MNSITITHLTELHTLLDSLTHGQTVTATWDQGDFNITATGPVEIDGKYIGVFYCLRYASGGINYSITSVEATVEQTTTATRDDPAALLELVGSLADGQKVTAEWRSEDGERATITTGHVRRGVTYVDVWDMWGEDHALSERGDLITTLYSVTTTVARTVRWEREA